MSFCPLITVAICSHIVNYFGLATQLHLIEELHLWVSKNQVVSSENDTIIKCRKLYNCTQDLAFTRTCLASITAGYTVATNSIYIKQEVL